MDFYLVFKLLHVLTAAAWFGGGLTLLVANILATRAKGPAEMFSILGTMNSLGKAWFVPTSFLTVIFGAIATTLGNMWGDLWVLIGLAGFVSTFLTGLLFIEPTGLRIAKALEEGREADALAAGQRLMRIVRFDYVVMLVVMADMVLKPQFGDWDLLIGMALIVVAGALLFVVLPGQRTATA
ncbi:MAG: DUF2269 family protein [Devosia sp.]